MRAAILGVHGEPPSHAEHPDPVPTEGQSIVRVTAAPVVPLDLLCASGTSYFGAPPLPYVPGVQGVGVVEYSAVLDPGTRVFFATSAGMAAGDGSFAERCAVPDVDLIALEAPVEDTVVAAIGLSGVAAWMTLTWRAQLQRGERVLVLGGGGAVGQAAIGVARVLEAGRITAVCRSEDARQRALAAGAHEVVAMTPDVDELTSLLAHATGGAVDVVIDPVFGVAATAAARILANGGRLVNLGGASGDEATFSSSVLRSRSASILGYTNNSLTPDQRRDALTAVLRYAAAGRIAVAHETVPLLDVAAAWQRQAAGQTSGRLVLTI
ncbi:NADPH:quinone reductase-like Zn-dependent oxidoreductase [Kribbella orskensis]|uniref:NADPH:quinone reductase-like Zn-dependent oxidoreductase n=1 Tax=Kribbella orskensis TaxID=2512216 RepID=A0ABY2BIA2_9ACTN|nr:MULTISPECIES: zinc-binding alcohol dehydrogenase family protein [Kribbella]TCN36990.1 NADPH:quinone reductase-like Zn-dependent oxidoreductase [Kribbella sp. VKM Ac-2500]TCO18415.1 NADPH:quinone reductase-like Zn-dependent oxidoreductase [Kribbella orskensis]